LTYGGEEGGREGRKVGGYVTCLVVLHLLDLKRRERRKGKWEGGREGRWVGMSRASSCCTSLTYGGEEGGREGGKVGGYVALLKRKERQTNL